MVRSLNSHVALAICLLLFFATFASPVGGHIWTNASGDGNYDNDLNWNPEYKPGPSDQVDWFDVGGMVNFNAHETCNSALINNAVTWGLDGYRFEPSGVIVGGGAPTGSHLTAIGGTVLTSHTGMGDYSSSSLGALTIDSTRWESAGMVTCGGVADGTLRVTNVGTLFTNDASVGAIARGAVTIEGQSTWVNYSQMRLGENGTAVVEVTGQSIVESGGQIFMAADHEQSSAHVTIEGNGSSLMSGNELVIGQRGAAMIVIRDGAQMQAGQEGSGNADYEEVHIAEEVTSQASVTIDGMGSKLLAGGELFIARGGDATVVVSSGGTLSSGAWGGNWLIEVARDEGSVADLTIDGAGSSMTGGGHVVIAEQGTARVTVSGGGRITTGRDDSMGILLAGQSQGEAELVIEGPGSCVLAKDGFDIGGMGTATVAILDGGELVAERYATNPAYVNLAREPGSTANVVIDGVGSCMDVDGGVYVGGTQYNMGGNATLAVNNGGAIEATGEVRVYETGSLTVDGGSISAGSLQVLNPVGLWLSGGSVHVTSGAQISEGSSLVMDNNSSFSATLLENRGLIRGSGTIHAGLINETTGTIRVAGSDYLEIACPPVSNHGQINLIGGIIDFYTHVYNQPEGTISGRGGLIFNNGMTNHGKMNFGGDTDIYGRVVNGQEGSLGSDGEITFSSGASGAFYDDVVHNGIKFKVSPNANVAFFGLVTGAGSFTGGGGVWFEGGYSPGNSPAWVQIGVDLTYGSESINTMELAGYIANGPGDTEYDVIEMIDGSKLTLGGTLNIDLLDGFEPVFGSTFDIYRYGSGDWAGVFSTFNSPTWDNGLYFDVTYWDTAVTLRVVPEPTSLSLLLLGGVVLTLLYRRRKQSTRANRVRTE